VSQETSQPGATSGKKTLRDGNRTLQASRDMPVARIDGEPGKKKVYTVSMGQLKLFVKPAYLEHPETTGRLELFAQYGPADQEGRLRGGIGGMHVHTDHEIHLMIVNQTRELLFKFLKRPRSTVEVIVDTLLPLALHQNYTWPEIEEMLSKVPCKDGLMEFGALQDVVLSNQRKRLCLIVKDGSVSKEIGPKVPFYCEAAEILTTFTKKKKQDRLEEQRTKEKKLATCCTLIGGLEDQNLSQELAANVMLLRGFDSRLRSASTGTFRSNTKVNDKWDRYCALRRTGKVSYVSARNEVRSDSVQDGGLANKHAGSSSLVSSLMA